MVWKPENRARYNRRGERYPSDLKNEEWAVLGPMLPIPKGTGCPRAHQLREIMNGIRYVLRYGIPWDAMPKDLPPSSICYDYWRLLCVKVTSANVQDQNGGITLLKRLVRLCPFVQKIVVDGGYKAAFIDAVKAYGNRVAELIKRPEFAKGFVHLPKRWRVEQSVGALTISRRLKTDYESLIHASAAAITLASIGRLLASITLR